MGIVTKSYALTDKWQKINVDGTTTMTISPRKAGGTIQPVQLCITADELDPDSPTEDWIYIGGDGSPATIAGITTENVYVRTVGNIAGQVGVMRDQT